jgi:hypothetical protein
VDIGALDAEALHEVVVQARGTWLPRAELRRVHDVSGGNPFFAIELARALEARRGYDLGAPLPLPTSLHDLVRSRLADVEGGTDLLAVVAALAQATVAGVRAVAGTDADSQIEAAVDAGVLRRDGERLRFTHPLLASAAYAELSPSRRRALHGRLAGATEDPLERGHHSLTPRRPRMHAWPRSLNDAVAAARQRGARQAAADLGGHARRLTPRRRRRRCAWSDDRRSGVPAAARPARACASDRERGARPLPAATR